MSSLLRNIRFGGRILIQNPVFAIVAIATLAVAIGMCAVIFSVVNGILLNSESYENIARLVRVEEFHPRSGPDPRPAATARYLDWQDQAQSFEGLLGFRWGRFLLTDTDDGKAVGGVYITPGGLELLGMPLELGRTFRREDAEPGAEPVAIIGHELWENRYQRDPDIVGRRIEIDERPARVIGVLEAGQYFRDPSVAFAAPLWISRGASSRTDHDLHVMGLLSPAASLREASAEMELIAQRLARAHPDTDRGWTVGLLPENQINARDAGGSIASLLAFGFVGCVLLLACANVGNLLLARATARQKEMATRAAIGASRSQIVVQLLAEGVVLALCALPVALVVARLGLDLFLSRTTSPVMRLLISIDGSVIAFTAAASVATVLLFGLIPALFASRVDLNAALKSGGDRGSSGAGSVRTRVALVAVQTVVALVLMVAAGLLTQNFRRIYAVSMGFETEGLVGVPIALREEYYPDNPGRAAFARRLLARLRSHPQLREAGLASTPPFNVGRTAVFHVKGDPIDPESPPAAVVHSATAPGYFDTIGLPILRGRGFEASDDAQAPLVSVVSESFAKQHFPDRDPIGKHLVLPGGDERKIVGLVGDVASFGLSWSSSRVYSPMDQFSAEGNAANERNTRLSPNEMVILARGMDARSTLGPVVRSIVREIDPLVIVGPLFTMEEEGQYLVEKESLSAFSVLLVGVVALVLATAGIYGLVSYSAARRLREFAIRAALGAEPRHIGRLVLDEAWRITAVGLGGGLVLSLLVGRILAAFIPGTRAFDPVVFGGSALLMAVIILCASTWPSIRAARADPMIALRQE